MVNIMIVVNMNVLNESQLLQAAQILADELPIGWPTLADALHEVNERWKDTAGAAFFTALNSDDEVIGWCGVLPQYDGHVYELHPLAVRRDWQRKGVGTKLVREAERYAAGMGGLTMWIGADDERPGGETSFANVDLYDNLPDRMRKFEPGTHQTAFYLKLGYAVAGVVPDANGIGKPDIFLAKRLK